MPHSAKNWVRMTLAALIGGIAVAASAQAQESIDKYPSRAVTILAPFSAGGPADQFTRVQAEMLEKKYGVPFIVENVPGAGGIIAGQRLASRPADGYTWFSASSGLLTIIPNLGEGMAFNPSKDVEMIGVVRSQPLLIVARNDAPYKTLRELIAHAKANPDKITYGSIGVNSLLHLAGEMLNELAGIKLKHVPYPGSAQYTVDLLGGRIDLAVSTPGTLVSHKDKLRALVQTAEKRSFLAPDVPTGAEAGVPGFVIDSWTANVVKKGTPQPLIDKMAGMLKALNDDPAYQDRFKTMDAQAIFISGKDFKASLDEQVAARTKSMAGLK